MAAYSFLWVEWTTDADNRGAMAFYEGIGARPLASKVFYRAPADPAS
jgi:hypothetical protein